MAKDRTFSFGICVAIWLIGTVQTYESPTWAPVCSRDPTLGPYAKLFCAAIWPSMIGASIIGSIETQMGWATRVTGQL